MSEAAGRRVEHPENSESLGSMEKVDEKLTIIRGGTLVTATDIQCADLLIKGTRIAGIVEAGDNHSGDARVLEAAGCFVMPGGVDPHTHLEHSVGPSLRTSDDFYSGTAAAAAGGTTTIVDFACNRSEMSLAGALQARRAAAAEGAIIDYGFHSAITGVGLAHGTEDMEAVQAQGVRSFKVYMAYPGRMMSDDETILRVMAKAAELDCVVLVHAENGHVITYRTKQLLERGQTAERFHLHAHTEEAEAEAIDRAITLARTTECRLHIVHVSSRSGAERIARARQSGDRVTGETCPQYLLRSYEDYENLGFDAARFICSPPIRQRRHQEALWRSLRDDVLSVVATDHAPFFLNERDPELGSKERGRGHFPTIPNGVPGIEERLRLILEGGTEQGRLTLCRVVDVTSTQPAKAMGLYPRKGSLTVGADADVVIWRRGAPEPIASERQHGNIDYSLYEGLETHWRPEVVISRGDVVVAGNEIMARPGHGRYLGEASGGAAGERLLQPVPPRGQERRV